MPFCHQRNVLCRETSRAGSVNKNHSPVGIVTFEIKDQRWRWMTNLVWEFNPLFFVHVTQISWEEFPWCLALTSQAARQVWDHSSTIEWCWRWIWEGPKEELNGSLGAGAALLLRVVLCILPSTTDPSLFHTPLHSRGMSWWKTRFARAPGFSLGSACAGGGRWSPPDPPCGWEMPVELCGAALGTGSLEKNVAVFSEGAPPPCPVKRESGPARGSRPYKAGKGGNCCSAFARQKPPHPLSNRPEIQQPWLSPGVFPSLLVQLVGKCLWGWLIT